MQSTLRKIARNSLIILSGNMGANVFSLLSTTIFTRSMGAEAFGYYAILQTYLIIADRVFGFQTWQGFIKYGADFQAEDRMGDLRILLKYCFLVDAAALVTGFVIMAGTTTAFVSFFDFPAEYSHLVPIMALTLLFKVCEISTGIFRIFDKFGIQSHILVATAASKAAMFGAIALCDPDFEKFIYATVASQGVMLAMKTYFAVKVLRENGVGVFKTIREPIDRKMIRANGILSFTFFTNFVVTLRMVSRQLDVVLLGKMAAPEMVGIYKIAKEVANLIGQLTDPVYNTIYPEFAKLLSGDRKREAWGIARKISFFAGASGLVFFFGFLLFGKLGLRLGFGRDFESAYLITCVYYAAIFIAVVSLPVTPMIFAFGLAKQAFRDQVVATTAYVVAVVPLIYHFSVIGAAAAYSVYYLAWLGLSMRTLMPRLRAA